MQNFAEIIGFWNSWQLRGFLFSILILIAAAPRHIRSPIWRHWILFSGSSVLIVLPIVFWLVPVWAVPILPTEIFIKPFEPPVSIEYHKDTTSSLGMLLFIMSVSGSVILTLKYLRSAVKLNRTVRASKAISSTSMPAIELCFQDTGVSAERVEVLLCSENIAPFTFGALYPKIVLPNRAVEWSKDDLRVVMIHELQHIRRYDWLCQQAATMMTILYPLNPLAWMIRSSARAQAEESVDKLSLQFNIAPMAYADTLLRRLRECRLRRNSLAVHMHNRADIVQRITSLVSEPYCWPDMKGRHRIAVFCSAILLIMPLALVTPVSQPLPARGYLSLNPIHIPPSDPKEDSINKTSISGPVVIAATRVDVPLLGPTSISYEIDDVHRAIIEPEIYDAVSNPVINIPIEARPLRLETPVYPSIALRRGRESTVQVMFDLDDEGGVTNPSIVGPSKSAAAFERSVLEAISSSRYRVDDPYGRDLITKGLTQTYVFQLVETNQPKESTVLAQQPP